MERILKLKELHDLISNISDDTPVYKIQELIEEYHRIIGVCV